MIERTNIKTAKENKKKNFNKNFLPSSS